MEAAGLGAPAPRRSVGRRLADLFHGRPRLQVGALLAGPVGWLVIGYLGSLLILLIASFWSLGELSGELEHTFTFDNFNTLLTDTVYRTITLRTILSEDGVLNWLLDPLGLSGPGYGNVAVWLVMSYIWLPYMIIPVYAGLERIPNSVLAASDDLGAKPWHTFRRVIWPLVFPALVAGSIFTFSLTLGDFITPQLVSSTQFIGNVIYANFTTNLPLAAAFATVPIMIMIIYLLIARRFGAFEHV
jgi:putative spermidine/putrescine transport system permease protein